MTCSAASLLDTTLSLRLEVLVESLLAAAFLGLHLGILLLEAATLLLSGKDLFDESAFAVLVLDSGRQVLRRTLDDGTDLAVLGCLHLAAILLVVAVRVEDVTHLQELQVSLELGCEIGAGKVVPLGTRSCFLLLVTMSADAPIDVADRVRQCGGSVSE
jgi:hypothetical protein